LAKETPAKKNSSSVEDTTLPPSFKASFYLGVSNWPKTPAKETAVQWRTQPCPLHLKGPKLEIFGFRVFSQIRPVGVGDLGTRQKNSTF
jgi:hypothetical protein